MAKMVNPELEVVRFENEDVIATSGTLTRRANGTWVYNGVEYATAEALAADWNNTSIQDPSGNSYVNTPNSSALQLTSGQEYSWTYSNGTYYYQNQ